MRAQRQGRRQSRKCSSYASDVTAPPARYSPTLLHGPSNHPCTSFVTNLTTIPVKLTNTYLLSSPRPKRKRTTTAARRCSHTWLPRLRDAGMYIPQMGQQRSTVLSSMRLDGRHILEACGRFFLHEVSIGYGRSSRLIRWAHH
jgi:hypothetical protein